jgi:hypothetical protein
MDYTPHVSNWAFHSAYKYADTLSALDKDKMTDEDTDGLLDLIGLRDLHDGPLGFYRHIVDLFEKERVYSYVVDFAKIAIQFAILAKPDEVSLPISF